MGKYDGWLNSKKVEINGLCDKTTIDHYCVENIVPNEHKTDEYGFWMVSPDVCEVIQKAKKIRIHIKYALQHMDEIKALPDDYISLVDAANDIPCDYSTLAKCLRNHDVPGIKYIDGHRLLKKQLVNKCKNKNNKEIIKLFEQLDITNTNPDAIKFREEFEIELEAPVEAFEYETPESKSDPKSFDAPESISSISSDVFQYYQGHKFTFKNIPVIYIDDDPNPILLPPFKSNNEGVVA